MSQTPGTVNRAVVIDVIASLRPQQLPDAARLPRGEIPADVECVICGASLTGLRSDRRCRQCGAAAGRSLAGNFLKFADPAYVRQLAEATTWLFWSTVTIATALGVGWILAFAAEAPAVLLGVAMAGAVLGAVGAWRLTEPAPNALDGVWELKACQRIRAASVVAVALTVAALATRQTARTGWPGVIAAIIELALAGGAVVGLRALTTHMGKLALRLPNLALARHTRFTSAALVAVAAAQTGLGFCHAFAAALNGAAAGAGLLGNLIYVGWIAIVCIGVVWAFLLRRYGGAFADQATISEQTWAHVRRVPANG